MITRHRANNEMLAKKANAFYILAMGKKLQFRKDMTIEDALRLHPEARDIFIKHGMSCIACLASTLETIEVGAEMHGAKIDRILADLNRLLESD